MTSVTDGTARPPSDTTVLCIGAGPAGLTAGYLLSRERIAVTVIERDPVYVGGISKTVCYRGFHSDIGGHRFFSKSQEVEALWTEILGDDFLDRPRASRIYYRGKLFDYPLRATDALRKLGIIEAMRCVSSYVKARLSPIGMPRNFEEWVTNQFGHRLFSIFFKTYTEKVWGMKCTEISADWAAQRIQGMSLARAIRHAILPPRRRQPRDRSKIVKTLIDTFRYPRRGPGMMWDAATAKIRAQGGRVLLGMSVIGCAWSDTDKSWMVTAEDGDGHRHEFFAQHVISSMAIGELVPGLSPSAPEAMITAARGLRYRDFVTVVLIVKERHAFDDNWIYIHSPDVLVGRIQNFKSWSPEMVPDPAFNCLGLEYFCFAGDGVWTSTDAALIDLGRRELLQLGLAASHDIVDGYVVRQAKAYPVYDDKYQDHVATVRRGIEEHYPNLHLVGRNGMHKYNNQDHAMMTAMLTVENILAGRLLYDVWNVNQDAEYHESGKAATRWTVVEREQPVAQPSR
jgi:protoporphyrinogen oxidase